ncbi:uncharacterized protein LOC107701638 [Sinocyclocheilus anshuiensis]|uniref:uncharacterized protein LOC107701638 n=1 Tax=Sinocyclocheilus anshuiensis TaxID=1608454 RepID=UPI0007B88D59|nr:PREDICTED: uncharacterized protein LOC107701638 [Sinocyclocheilus anshuiensis]
MLDGDGHRQFEKHQTILNKGHGPLLSVERCTICCRKYHCAYCKLVYNHLNELQNHVVDHVRVAVHHKGMCVNYYYVIVKCNQDCRQAAHFHCCYCTSTLIRRDALIKHLTSCKETSFRQPPPAAAAAAPPTAPTPSPVAPPPPPPLAAPAPVFTAAPPPALSPSAPPPVAPIPFPAAPPPHPSPAAPPPALSPAAPPPYPAAPSSVGLCVRQQVRVTCMHCGIQINKRNLLVHINRKHRQKVTEISAKRHLSCQCIDAKNGISAVNKAFFKPCSPIHVQKKTWGASQNIICELNECKTNSEFAVRSRILPYECMHLKSLLFCPRMDNASIIMEEEVLSEMVAAKIFGDTSKQSCLNRQKAAADAGVALAVKVTVGGPPSKKFLSIYECNNVRRSGRRRREPANI